MSNDAIHNSSPAANEQTETTIEEISEHASAAEQPNVTEQPNLTGQPEPAENSVESATQAAIEDAGGTAVEEPGSFLADDQAGKTSIMGRQGFRRPMLKMSKEQLIAAIVEITDKLGHVPSHAELMRSGKVSGRQIVKHFGTYTRALRACNLERHLGGHKVPLEKLFLDWARVVREIKRIPSKSDYETMGKHSITPLRARFGSWARYRAICDATWKRMG